MTMTQQMTADVAGIETVDSEFVTSFTHKGKSYDCQITPIAGRLAMQDAGDEQLFDFMMQTRANQFVSPDRPPVERDVILIGSVEYRVADATTDQVGAVITCAMKQNT